MLHSTQRLTSIRLLVLGTVVLGMAILSLASPTIARWRVDASEPETTSASGQLDIEEDIEALLVARDTPRLPDLPGEAEEIVSSYDATAAEIRRKAAREIREHRLRTMRQLKAIQDKHTQTAQLDEAVAIRDTIRRMLEPSAAGNHRPRRSSSARSG